MHFSERLHSFGKDWETLWLMHYAVSELRGFCAISGLSGSRLPLMLFVVSQLNFGYHLMLQNY